MQRPKTLKEIYQSCIADGYLREIKRINIQKIKSLMMNALTNINLAQIIIKSIAKGDKEWMGVYINYYDALRICTEAFLLFEKFNIPNHQCLFAYLCTKHPELELDWNFFEKVRKKRNGINYYGEQVSYDDWKSIEVQIKLYISALKKEIDKLII